MDFIYHMKLGQEYLGEGGKNQIPAGPAREAKSIGQVPFSPVFG